MISLLSKWLRESRGTTAVEFTMVGVPFILMMVGIIEMSIMFTAQSLLQESTFNAARLIRTGQLQGGADPEDMFRTAVCDFAALLIPCAQIQFQVSTLPSFADADIEPPEFDEDGTLLDAGFDPGVANDIVLVRVVYNYPIRTPMMAPILSNNGTTNRTMMSTMVLQTEPYE